ncbi:MAG TPA: helix-turn-helix domain-containing protein [Candidatus Binatus sp.]|nr:helix-turn-helix domain-containing protein [Candidatus Binatus sp.]
MSVEPLMSVKDVCEALSVSRQTVYRLIADGQLPFLKICGRTLFRPGDVERFITRSTRRVGEP